MKYLALWIFAFVGLLVGGPASAQQSPPAAGIR